METVAVLIAIVLVFAGIVYMLFRRIWKRYKVISVGIPFESDPQAINFKIGELIRSYSFQQTAAGVYQAPKWQRWMVGLHNILVESPGEGLVVLSGPAYVVLQIGSVFKAAQMYAYTGPQPLWPLLRGVLRVFGIGVGVMAVLFGVGIFFAK